MNIFHELGLKENTDRINEEIIYNTAHAYTFIDAFVGQLLSAYKLSTAKFNILMVVKHIGSEKGLSQHEISKLLFVTTSNMTRMIDKLEKSGYVKRINQEGDRRVNLIKITKEGSELLDAIWPHYKDRVDKLMESQFSKTEKHQLNKLLEKFKRVVKVGIA
jgi:DNA-binding MarR family transcriptional regulator